MKTRYQVRYYHDVWGNEEDGFWVNDQSVLGTIEVEDADKIDDVDFEEKVIDFFEHVGFGVANIHIDRQSSDERIEFNIGEHDMPFAALVKVEE